MLSGGSCRLVRLGGEFKGQCWPTMPCPGDRIDLGSRGLSRVKVKRTLRKVWREPPGRQKMYQSSWWELPSKFREGTQQLRAQATLGKDPLLLAHSHLPATPALENPGPCSQLHRHLNSDAQTHVIKVNIKTQKRKVGVPQAENVT